MQQILKAYLKRLTDLTAANKSLLLLQLPAEQFVDLHAFDFLNGKPSFDVVAGLMAGKTTVPLCDVLDSRYDRVNEASRRLQQIARTAAFIAAERGTQDLYAGYPTVRGKLADGTPVRCPLLFFPVDLDRKGNAWSLRPREGEAVSFNKTFLLAYAYFNDVKVSDKWLEMSFEAFSPDPLVFRTQLYEKLKESPLEINFNPDSFTDKLQPFEKFTRAGFGEGGRNGEIKLYPEAVLGIFPQAGSYLAPDYRELIERDGFESPETFFDAYAAGPAGDGKPLREESLLTPFPLDASQEKAVQAAKAGGSLVVQGPPGTGKSQLICNLIADYTARGKKVLLVCQKRAALDVVYARLKSLGMADFAALVHDFRHDRKAIYAQIAAQIGRLEAYKRQNLGLDAILLDREFLQESRKIDRLAAELEEFRAALFDDKACGLSPKALYLTSRPDGPAVSLKKEYKHFHFDAAGAFGRRLADYQAYAARLERADYAWQDRVSFAGFTDSDRAAIEEALDEIPRLAAEVVEQAATVTGGPWTLELVEQLDTDERKLTHLLDTLKTTTQWEIFKGLLARTKDEVWSGKELDARERKLLKCLKGEGIDKSLSFESLPAFEEKLKKARRARQSWLRWQWWRLVDPNREAVRKVAASNGLPLTREGLKALSEKVQNRVRIEAAIAALEPVGPTAGLYEEAGVRAWFTDQRQALKARKIAEKTEFWLLHGAWLLPPRHTDLQKKIFQLFAIAAEWTAARRRWANHLTDKQVRTVLQNPGCRAGWNAVLREDFDALTELDGLKEDFTPVEREVLGKLENHRRAHPGADLPALFDNSLRLAWIEHLEAKHPVLRGVSTLRVAGLENELQASLSRKMALSRDQVLLRLREQTYRRVEENRLGNRVTYRDLEHQVTKKRNVWPVRRLLTGFAGEIFQLVPCWMASPESVSALFPLEKAFDLVIFDEASQCYAERGIPAMYRGRQTVVTGDDKQLPPGDLYRVRFGEDDEEHPDLEVDSLLALAGRYFPQTSLRGHYRSQLPELIDFSNRHFYRGTLQLLPDREGMNRRQPAIRYVRVEGVWEHQTNRAEAERVAELVFELLRTQPGQEIGVVTFNFPQGRLIQDVLEAQSLERQVALPECLFVKNLENVQGDERDIIIFSIGYAPDPKGRLVMQFGSLNQAGGENRLNVAVTRAREAIYVVTSLLPAQLRTEEAQHEGPRLLREYLQYALDVSEGHYVPGPAAAGLAGGHRLGDRLAESMPGLVRELPFADLAVKNEGRYEGLVLTDDDLYFASLSAKEAHAYLPFLLARKGWPYRRLYSREWWKGKVH